MPRQNGPTADENSKRKFTVVGPNRARRRVRSGTEGRVEGRAQTAQPIRYFIDSLERLSAREGVLVPLRFGPKSRDPVRRRVMAFENRFITNRSDELDTITQTLGSPLWISPTEVYEYTTQAHTWLEDAFTDGIRVDLPFRLDARTTLRNAVLFFQGPEAEANRFGEMCQGDIFDRVVTLPHPVMDQVARFMFWVEVLPEELKYLHKAFQDDYFAKRLKRLHPEMAEDSDGGADR